MFKKAINVFVPVGMIIALCLFFGAYSRNGGLFRSPQMTSTATLFRQVQTLSQLVTVKYVLEKVVDVQDTKWYPGGDNKVLLVAHGIVKAGINLTNLQPSDIQIAGKKITLTLPHPVITDAYLDDHHTQVLERSTGILRAFDKDLEQNARKQAVDELRVAGLGRRDFKGRPRPRRSRIESPFSADRFHRSGNKIALTAQLPLGSPPCFCLAVPRFMKLYLPNVVVLLALAALDCQAQQVPFDIFGAGTNSFLHTEGDTNFFPNGVIASNANFFASADRAVVNNLTGEVLAEGDVIILDHGRIWRGTNAIYNFKSGEVRAGAFKTAEMPFNFSGQFLAGDTKNQIYSSADTIVTTDDYAKPIYRIHARSITIVPGKYFEARDATLYLGSMPIFYWPYYHRNLGKHPDNFEFVPGFRSTYGAYLLSAYNWYGNSNLDGTIHLDERTRRGLAAGPDLLFHLGDYGQAAFRYYYAHDQDPQADGLIVPHLGPNRQRMSFDYESPPATNFSAKILANYQSDPLIIRDFFESEYRADIAAGFLRRGQPTLAQLHPRRHGPAAPGQLL